MSNDIEKIQRLLQQDENSGLEFKAVEVRPDSLARELVAFSNTSGGIVLIGVSDDGTISGISARPKLEEWVSNVVRNNIIPAINPVISRVRLAEGDILQIVVAKGKDKPYQTIDGKYWIRVGSTNRMATKEELSRLFQQAGLIHFDIAPLEGVDITFLDEKKLQPYWYNYYSIDYFALEAIEQHRLLQNADIVVSDQQDNTVVSVGGLVIFGKEPQRRLPQSGIVFAVFEGDQLGESLLDKQQITGTLPELIQQTTTKIRLFLPRPSTISGLKRQETPVIPEAVIREALVNAVCHRDYSIATRRITVYLFHDRLEITSPGRLANTLTIEKMLTGNSAIRNPFILRYLDNMKFIDGLGRGVPMIKRMMGERCQYAEEGELLRLTLFYKVQQLH